MITQKDNGYIRKESSILHTQYEIDDSDTDRHILKVYKENVLSSIDFMAELLEIPISIEFTPGMWTVWTMELEDEEVSKSLALIENILQSNTHLLKTT